MKPVAKIVAAPFFNRFVIFVILLAGILVGLETYPNLVAKYGSILHMLDRMVLWIFVIEAALKILAWGRKPWNYFKDPWNVFDFTIVVVCFLPVNASFVAVLRLVRILRVLRLVTAIPKLQLIVGALLKSIPSMAYVTLLLCLLFYIYACMAVTLFGGNDPIHFGNLQISVLSLFRVVTLEDWTDVMYIAMYGCDQYGYGGVEHLCTAPKAMPVVGSLFFVSFVLAGTMIVMNLFIGVIMSGMEEAQRDQVRRTVQTQQGVEKEIHALAEKIDQIRDQVEIISRLTREKS